MEARGLMSIDLEAQVLAVAEAMRVRDAEVKAAYNRVYYGENCEYLLDQAKMYYFQNLDRITESKKDYRAANMDVIAEKKKAYRAANIDAISVREKAYRAANIDAKSVRNRAYYIVNRELLNTKSREYQAKKRSSHLLAVERKGEDNANAKLNDDLVRIIRLRSGTGQSQLKIAESLGVSRRTVGMVLSGKTWAHVI